MTDTAKRAPSSLERARYKKGYSREYVARTLGISAKTVERQERRERGLKRYLVKEYAALYGVEIEALADMLEPRTADEEEAAA